MSLLTAPRVVLAMSLVLHAPMRGLAFSPSVAPALRSGAAAQSLSRSAAQPQVSSALGLRAASTLTAENPSHLLVLHYEYVPDILDRRGPHRAGHLAAAKKVEDEGKLIVAGAYANPTDGAMFVFKDYSKNEIISFVESDPYVVNGLVTNWKIKEWTAVVGTGEV